MFGNKIMNNVYILTKEQGKTNNMYMSMLNLALFYDVKYNYYCHRHVTGLLM